MCQWKLGQTDALLPLIRPKQPPNFILMAWRVTETMADKLREKEVPFPDEGGNIFVNPPPWYIFIKGDRDPDLKKKPGAIILEGGEKLLPNPP